LPPFPYKASVLQAVHSAKDQLQSEKDACERRIADLKCSLDEKASQLSQSVEKIEAMSDTLQINEISLNKLAIENKSLDGELRAQRAVFDRVQTDLTAVELKLRDSVSKVSDLYTEVETKTASVLELKAVSCK
jgi:chromosome segregation ATPase